MKAKIFKIVGSDRDVVMASRVATDRNDKPLNEEQTDKAIKNLIKSRHWSPFEFAHLYIDIDAPIYVMRQWMRHPRPFMEKSRRYTKDEPKLENIEDYDLLGKMHESVDQYNYQIDKGTKPEDARKILPLATYTHVLWNPCVRDFLHFLRARLDGHAQREIRELAQSLYDQFKAVMPYTAKWFAEYELGEFSFSVKELRALVLWFAEDEEGYDVAMEVYPKSIEGILKNAQNRIAMVERVLAGADTKVSDSSKDSSSDGDTPTDS